MVWSKLKVNFVHTRFIIQFAPFMKSCFYSYLNFDSISNRLLVIVLFCWRYRSRIWSKIVLLDNVLEIKGPRGSIGGFTLCHSRHVGGRKQKISHYLVLLVHQQLYLAALFISVSLEIGCKPLIGTLGSREFKKLWHLLHIKRGKK